MKRYCIVGLAHPYRGGIAQYTSSLCLELAKSHEVHLISYRRQYPAFLFPGQTQIDSSSCPLQVPNIPLLDPLLPWTWYAAARRIRQLRPDAVLLMWWNPFFAPMLGTLTAMIRWRNTYPTAFLCHNVFPHEATLLDQWLLRWSFRFPTHFLVQSDSERQKLVRLRPKTPVKVIFHPAQTFFRPAQPITMAEARDRLTAAGILPVNPSGSPANRELLLFFGYIRHYKGVDLLLRAVALVRRKRPVELLLVGEFYEPRAAYERLIQELSLAGAVHLVDRYVPNEEVPAFFAASDVVVLPYRSGTQSGVVPLAYAMRRPVIVSSVGGIPEAVEEGKTGLLVPPGDVEALARTILDYFVSGLGPKFQAHMDSAADRMAWDRMVKGLNEFLLPEAGVSRTSANLV